MKKKIFALVMLFVFALNVPAYAAYDNYGEKFQDIMDLIEENYYDKDAVDKDALFKKAVNSMLNSLDPYSAYMENKELENHFLVHYYNTSLNKVRLSLFIAIIFYALFGIIDAAFIPDFENKYVFIRYLLVIPTLIAVLAFSFTRLYKKKIQFVSACLVVASNVGVVVMTVLAPTSFSNFYFQGILLILITNYGFLRQRFIWATAAGLISSIIYIVVTFIYSDLPFLQALMNSFFLITINTIGIFIARHNERYARRYYFVNHLLTIERVKLRTLNSRLEAKIKDKASQINMQRNIVAGQNNE